MRVSIVIPTRARLGYLEVALASLAPLTAGRPDVETVVVDDDEPSERARSLVERMGARYEPHAGSRGLNAARNTGVERTTGELVAFLDDDVRVDPGWLEGLLAGAAADPEVDVFAGRIAARIEAPPLRGCGREDPPVTALDLGSESAETRFAWGANMIVRRRALESVGPFDESLGGAGDEQEWQERLRAQRPGASVLYLPTAAVEHRRAGADARPLALARACHARGRAARRFDARRGRAPTPARELVTLARCTAHVALRRCPAGTMSVAHSAGRLREALAGGGGGASAHLAVAPGEDDFLSGASGTVGGLDGVRRRVRDAAHSGWQRLSGRELRLARAAREEPPRRSVLVIGVWREERGRTSAAIARELSRSRHEVELRTGAPDGRGKFERLGELLGDERPTHDWLLVVDDDVELPRAFLDRFLFLCERFALDLAQPAHQLHSHAAWAVTRRQPGSFVRETAFVEIGPVTAFARRTFPELLPFPALRMGWGLDAHWSALARDRGWRCGVVDATPIRHRLAPAASAYDRGEAIAEARAFLTGRPYVRSGEAERTLATHRRW